MTFVYGTYVYLVYMIHVPGLVRVFFHSYPCCNKHRDKMLDYVVVVVVEFVDLCLFCWLANSSLDLIILLNIWETALILDHLLWDVVVKTRKSGYEKRSNLI